MPVAEPCPYLGLHDLPPIGLELLELPKLHADILNGELQEVPEASQVLEGGHRECVGILWGQRDRVSSLSISGTSALLAMGPLTSCAGGCVQLSSMVVHSDWLRV